MATPVNTYATSAHLEMTLVEDAAMRDTTSQAGSSSATASGDGQDPPQDNKSQEQDYQKSDAEDEAEDTIEFDKDFQLPPSFNQPISEEMLCNDQHPFVLWATLKIPLPPNPGKVGNALFDCLASFVEATMEEDKSFIIFPFCLSKYRLATDLPKGIVDIETLPKEVVKWLPYFLQAKLQAKGGNLYTPILMGLS